MARKQKAPEGGGGSPAWMSTFSDLMNLLLCFFVLLFSMSTVDAEKFEEVVSSLQSSFSIFDGGSTSITKGELVSSGVSQLNKLNDYYNNMGMNQDENDEINADTIKKYKDYVQSEMIKDSENIADRLGDQLAGSGLGNKGDIELEVNAQYVTMTLNGALLFGSGSADIRSDATEFMDKLGDVLKNYDDYNIQIIGHTDTVPMAPNSKFADNWELSQGRAYTVLKYLIDKKGMNAKTMSCMGRGEYEPVASNDTTEGRASNRRVEIRIYNQISSETN